MVELTLLHLDVDVESVTARANAFAPFAKSVAGEEELDEGSGIEVETSSGGGRMKAGLAAAVVGLVFLVVAAVLLRRYVTEGGEEEEAEEEAESTPLTIE